MASVTPDTDSDAAQAQCASQLSLRALDGLGLISEGADLAELIRDALVRTDLQLEDDDILVVSSKVVSRAEGRFRDLNTVKPSPQASILARQTGKDASLCELVLQESTEVSRRAPDVLIVRSHLGHVSANAGIDASNAMPHDNDDPRAQWVQLLPEAPDASARRILESLVKGTGKRLAVVISDSLGRPFRLGTVGAALGVAALPAIVDARGSEDLFGRPLEHTTTALADQVAAAADLVAGQAAEGRAVVLVRGIRFLTDDNSSAGQLCRDADDDLYLRGGT